MNKKIMLCALLGSLTSPITGTAAEHFSCAQVYKDEDFINATYWVNQKFNNGTYLYSKDMVICYYTNKVTLKIIYASPYKGENNKWEYDQPYKGDITTYDPNLDESNPVATCKTENSQNCSYQSSL